MRRINTYAVAATMLIFFAQGTTCLAQGGLPPGDYKRTCQNMSMNGDKLFAYCQKVDGGWRNTSIDYRACRGPIINDNGYLRCGGNGGGYGHPGGGYVGGPYGGLPPGDYKRTCQNMSVNGDRLNATCQKVDGGWNNTSLKNFNQCRRGIVNDDGNLRCQK
jgi:hypothetical protein